MTREHGTYMAYAEGCRCDRCATYQRERVAASRRLRLRLGALSHGKRSAYDAGCRCERCRGARSEAYRRLEAQR